MENYLLAKEAAVWNNRILPLKTSDSATGYLNVLKQGGGKRKKPFYAKYVPEGESKQRTLPGSTSATAWEAAAKLAFHMETQAELPPTKARMPRRSSEVSMPSV